MNKKTPLVIFTGLAVAAAGTLGAVLTGNLPIVQAPQVVSGEISPAQPEAQPQASAAEQPEAPVVVPAAPEQQQAALTPEPVAEAPAVQAPAAVAAVAPPPADPAVPAFDTVNVMPSGEAVIAGHAKPGSEVVVKFAGLEIGKATAGADGSFALVPEKPLPTGAGALTLETVVDGKRVTSVEQIAVVVAASKPALVAKVEPSAQTKLVQAPSTGSPPKEVQLSAVDYDAQGNIVFQGRVTPGGTIRFYVDNMAVGDTKADEAGNWLFTGASPIAPGTHALRADEIDANGKVLSRAELPFLREVPEKVIAAAEQPENAEPDQVQPKSADVVSSSEPEQSAAVVEPALPTALPTDAAEQQITAETVVVSAATATAPSRIIIQPGNNLWRISREVYGKGQMFTVIWEANRDQIKDPDRVYPGQILTAPKS